MKSLIIIFILAYTSFGLEIRSPILLDYLEWLKTHKKTYADEELNQKFQNFVDNFKLIQNLNDIYKGKTEFSLNQFADMTHEEFRSKILMRISQPKEHASNKYVRVSKLNDLPDSFDWREQGAVTQVKDQGSVGTCWAFSTVQNVEGQWALKKGNKLTNLSVEQVVDCDGMQDPAGENADCGVYGGWPYLAFQYIKQAGGLASESNYSYCAGTGACAPCEAPGYNKTKCGPPIPYCFLKDSCQAKTNSSLFVPGLRVIDWVAVSKNETDIAQHLMQIGPLSVALNAQLLQFYHKGIFDPIKCDPTNLDHAVLMVGWGTEQSKIHGRQDYWIIKNSWGQKWGENGYFRILRNKGTCGINTQVTTAILA